MAYCIPEVDREREREGGRKGGREGEKEGVGGRKKGREWKRFEEREFREQTVKRVSIYCTVLRATLRLVLLG